MRQKKKASAHGLDAALVEYPLILVISIPKILEVFRRGIFFTSLLKEGKGQKKFLGRGGGGGGDIFFHYFGEGNWNFYDPKIEFDFA